jgi:hypothetical protein
LFVALGLIIDKEPKVFHLIPSKDLSQLDSNIFIENNASLMLRLSNWEIKISSNAIPELAKYALENMIDKLKIWINMLNRLTHNYPDDELANGLI